MAQSLLDTLLSGAKSLTQGEGVSDLTAKANDLAGKAKESWNTQSNLTKGAIAGGILGMLFTQGGRRLLGTGAKVGGAAVIGGLAYKAYQDWMAGKTAEANGQPVDLPQPGPGFAPINAAAADDLSLRLLQAMVAATKADGHVTEEERAKITAQLPNLGLGDTAQALLAAELDAPLDIDRIAGLAKTPEDAAQIYAASLLAIDPNGNAEQAYLAALAARLNLDAGLVAHLHSTAASL
jgi:uncharacterized membrane protein YebE (DUF533 family)